MRTTLGRTASGFGLLALLLGSLPGAVTACERTSGASSPTGARDGVPRVERSVPEPRSTELGAPRDGAAHPSRCEAAATIRDRCPACTARISPRAAIVTLLRTLRVALRLLRREMLARLDDPAASPAGGCGRAGALDEIVAVETGAGLLAGATGLAIYNPLTS